MNYIEKLNGRLEYKEIREQQLTEEADKYMESLKRDYIKTFTEIDTYSIFGAQELSEINKHSKQSEILGKLVTLTHEFKGYKGVQEVLHEIFWEYQNLVADKMDSDEKQLKEIASELRELTKNANKVF